MKDKKIGIYVSKLMKKHKITSKELASRINVSVNKIKKYENGIVTGNFETTKKLCEVLNISVNQLVMGKDNLTSKEIDESLVKVVKYYKKRSQRLYSLMFIIPVSLILLTIPIFLNLYRNRDLAYELNADSENFKIEHLMFMRDDGIYYLYPGSLLIKNDLVDENNISIVSLKCNKRLIYSSNSYINEMSIERKGYDELFPDEVVNNMDDWFYEITYSIDGYYKTEILKLNVKDLNK